MSKTKSSSSDPLPIDALFIDMMATPIGDITLSVDGQGRLRSLDWSEEGRADCYSLDRYYPDIPRYSEKSPSCLREALTGYFSGDVSAIETIAIALPGTEFQSRVWHALREIPGGTTCSYADIAHAIDNPKSTRAVGMANNANPIAIVVPCHRVIGADGSMIGYGSGVQRKEWLLRHEGVHAAQHELDV